MEVRSHQSCDCLTGKSNQKDAETYIGIGEAGPYFPARRIPQRPRIKEYSFTSNHSQVDSTLLQEDKIKKGSEEQIAIDNTDGSPFAKAKPESPRFKEYSFKSNGSKAVAPTQVEEENINTNLDTKEKLED